jgi:uncharacterized membrane protein YvlD (DUF360 family)
MTLRRLPSMLAIWLATALAVLLCGWIFSSVSVTTFGSALLSALVIGLANAFLWPVLIRLALPLTVITLGLGALVLNGAIVLLVAAITPGLAVNSLAGGIGCALIITAVTTLTSSMFFIDDDERVARHLVRRASERHGEVVKSDVPGVLFLEIERSWSARMTGSGGRSRTRSCSPRPSSPSRAARWWAPRRCTAS